MPKQLRRKLILRCWSDGFGKTMVKPPYGVI
jgi:hypothetical protein